MAHPRFCFLSFEVIYNGKAHRTKAGLRWYFRRGLPAEVGVVIKSKAHAIVSLGPARDEDFLSGINKLMALLPRPLGCQSA